MSLIRRAFMGGVVEEPPFALGQVAFGSVPVTEGATFTCSASVSGGTPPYLYELLVASTVYASTTTSAVSASVYATALMGWDGYTATMRVTDKNGAGRSLTSGGQAVRIYYLRNSTTPSYSWGGAGTAPTLYSYAEGYPSVSTCYWYYYDNIYPAGWVQFGGSGLSVAAGVIPAGRSFSFRNTATNSAGSATSSILTLSA